MKHIKARQVVAIMSVLVLLLQVSPMVSAASTPTPVGSAIGYPSGNISLDVGSAQQVAVALELRNGEQVNIAQDCTWTSSDTSVVSMLEKG